MSLSYFLVLCVESAVRLAATASLTFWAAARASAMVCLTAVWNSLPELFTPSAACFPVASRYVTASARPFLAAAFCVAIEPLIESAAALAICGTAWRSPLTAPPRFAAASLIVLCSCCVADRTWSIASLTWVSCMILVLIFVAAVRDRARQHIPHDRCQTHGATILVNSSMVKSSGRLRCQRARTCQWADTGDDRASRFSAARTTRDRAVVPTSTTKLWPATAHRGPMNGASDGRSTM